MRSALAALCAFAFLIDKNISQNGPSDLGKYRKGRHFEHACQNKGVIRRACLYNNLAPQGSLEGRIGWQARLTVFDWRVPTGTVIVIFDHDFQMEEQTLLMNSFFNSRAILVMRSTRGISTHGCSVSRCILGGGGDRGDGDHQTAKVDDAYHNKQERRQDERELNQSLPSQAVIAFIIEEIPEAKIHTTCLSNPLVLPAKSFVLISF